MLRFCVLLSSQQLKHVATSCSVKVISKERPEGIPFQFGTNVNLDSVVNWLGVCGRDLPFIQSWRTDMSGKN